MDSLPRGQMKGVAGVEKLKYGATESAREQRNSWVMSEVTSTLTSIRKVKPGSGFRQVSDKIQTCFDVLDKMMKDLIKVVSSPLVVTYGYLGLYIALSCGVILYNKWVLSSNHYGFPYPITLTMIHMGFSGFIAILLVRVFKVVEPVKMSFEIYVSSVVPISGFFAASLWFSNTAYLYLSVAFIQMLKALMPVATFLMAITLRTDKPRCDIFWNMILVSAGVVIASVGEIHFNIVGTLFQVTGIAAEALRLVLTQVLLQKKGLTLNPITSLYYIAPCSFLFLSVPWAVLEKPAMMLDPNLKFDFWVFFTNALCALALNFSVFLVIGRTGAITVRVAGVLKDWILIGLSTILFPDSKLTVLNVLGYTVALSGVVLYNYLKMKDSNAAKPLSIDSYPDKPKDRMLEQKTLDLESGRSEDGSKIEVEGPLIPTKILNEEEVPLISRPSHEN